MFLSKQRNGIYYIYYLDSTGKEDPNQQRKNKIKSVAIPNTVQTAARRLPKKSNSHISKTFQD